MEIVFTKQTIKDFEKIKQNLTNHKIVVALLELLESNPYTNSPLYEKLIGINNTYSRRINIQHRLVYQVYDEKKVIKIIRMRPHYEKRKNLIFEESKVRFFLYKLCEYDGIIRRV